MPSSPPRPLRQVQLNDRPECSGPEFTIKSGQQGGEWSSDRGDLQNMGAEPTQIGT